MSVAYRAVNWNRHKKVYDVVIASGVAAFIGTFVLAGKLAWTGERAISDEVLLIRALGVCAFAMLWVILCIGPLARFDPRFAPLLYNRRHLGVSMFLVALSHALLSALYYGGFGITNPAFAMLGSASGFDSISGFPFEWLGAGALSILFVMAATSHDFWLKNLTPRVWKSIHMLVYLALALLVLHVSLGALQSERSLVYPVLLGTSVSVLAVLHVAAGLRELRRGDACRVPGEAWIDIGAVDDIPPNRARRVCLAAGHRVAVFRHEGGVSAISDVCAHQGGPLSEGKVVDGCVTCPWHGYQYLPDSGRSPPPYTERLATYEVRTEGRRILLNAAPLDPGTPTTPAPIPEAGP